MAGAEVENAAPAAAERAAAAEHLAALEGRDENQLVRLGDVEVLAVHFLLGDGKHLRQTAGNRMAGADCPDLFALTGFAPAQLAGGAHQFFEDLGLVAGVEHHHAHPQQHALVDPRDHAIVDTIVGDVAPPGQDVGLGQNRFGQPVLGLVEGGRTDVAGRVFQVLTDTFGDRRVHAVGIDGAYPGLLLFVQTRRPGLSTDARLA